MLIVTVSCHKEKVEILTIQGEVFNLCTDSLLPNVPVYLMGGKNNVQIKLKTYTNSSGTFEFRNVEIRGSFSYALYIPTSLDTINMYHQPVEFLGGGCTKYFDIKDASQYHILKVDPFSLGITYKCNFCDYIIPPSDSIYAYLYQPVFKKNSPYGVYFSSIVTSRQYPFYNNHQSGSLRMGKWILEIHKYKGGNYTYVKDSIYLPYWSRKTYTLNW